jgi:hypothetical protein
MKHLKHLTTLALASAVVALSSLAHAQSAAIIDDAFGPEAEAWLNKNPAVLACVRKRGDATIANQKRMGHDQGVSAATFGEFIQKCANTSKVAAKPRPAPVEVVEEYTPNGPIEARNRRNKKAWQDNNGYMHYPNGKMSEGPVD